MRAWIGFPLKLGIIKVSTVFKSKNTELNLESTTL